MAKTATPTPTTARPQDKPINLKDLPVLETDIKESCEGMLLCHRERLKKLASALFEELVKAKAALAESQAAQVRDQEALTELRDAHNELLNQDALRAKTLEDLQAKLTSLGGESESSTETSTSEQEDEGEVEEPADTDDDDGTAGEPYPETQPQA